MKSMEKLSRLWANNRKVLTIVIACVLSVLFAGSIILAVFIGGEFKPKAVEQVVKGRMSLTEFNYKTSYLSGAEFIFDKESTKIQLIAKDPDKTEIVKIENLEKDAYGFLVNGEGNIYDEASSIIMDTEMQFISVVSKEYPTLKIDIPVKVISSESIRLVDELTFEAEEANLYRNEKQGYKLLTDDEKKSQPSTEKPFLSSAGEVVMSGENINCSGGACIRSLGDLDVKVEFEVACTQETTVDLEILICKRPQAKNFGDSFKLYLNGEAITAADRVSIPARSTGETDYFTSYTMQKIQIKLVEGVNVITFENQKTNPGNLDAIKLIADSSVIGAFVN